MGNYDDIINLPHHTSQRHPRMSMYNRAAQFSPFAALTGYEKAIEEARKKQEAEVRRRNTPVEDELPFFWQSSLWVLRQDPPISFRFIVL